MTEKRIGVFVCRWGGNVSDYLDRGWCARPPRRREAFPRQIIHFLQIGHREKLAASLEPWLCYYCGECLQICPREADPGEIMMAARRYLTAAYDWLLASGYATMLALVVIGLRRFQTGEIRPLRHPTRLLGYFATAVLLYVSAVIQLVLVAPFLVV